MKLICFDLDDTLVNSSNVSVKAYNYALKKNGFKKKTRKEILSMAGMVHIEIAGRLTNVKNKRILEKICLDHDEAIIKRFYKEIKIIKNVKETLKKLKKRYKIAIVSNASHKTILAELRGAKISKSYFDFIIGNDDVKKSKPSPDEILKAEKLFKHKAEYLIGDSIYDVMAAKKAKVKVISVLSGNYSKRELLKYKPDYIISDIKKLLEII